MSDKLAEALKCIEEDDLDSLKDIVPAYVPVDVKLKEFFSFLCKQFRLGRDWKQPFFILPQDLGVNYVYPTYLNKELMSKQ